MKAIFRLWIAGTLTVREEHELDDTSGIVGLAERHADMVERSSGQPWLAEFEFPELRPDERYMRFGTDTDGMVDPQLMRLRSR